MQMKKEFLKKVSKPTMPMPSHPSLKLSRVGFDGQIETSVKIWLLGLKEAPINQRIG